MSNGVAFLSPRAGHVYIVWRRGCILVAIFGEGVVFLTGIDALQTLSVVHVGRRLSEFDLWRLHKIMSVRIVFGRICDDSKLELRGSTPEPSSPW